MPRPSQVKALPSLFYIGKSLFPPFSFNKPFSKLSSVICTTPFSFFSMPLSFSSLLSPHPIGDFLYEVCKSSPNADGHAAGRPDPPQKLRKFDGAALRWPPPFFLFAFHLPPNIGSAIKRHLFPLLVFSSFLQAAAYLPPRTQSNLLFPRTPPCPFNPKRLEYFFFCVPSNSRPPFNIASALPFPLFAPLHLQLKTFHFALHPFLFVFAVHLYITLLFPLPFFFRPSLDCLPERISFSSTAVSLSFASCSGLFRPTKTSGRPLDCTWA